MKVVVKEPMEPVSVIGNTGAVGALAVKVPETVVSGPVMEKVPEVPVQVAL